ncbi:nitrite/sulfite reductase [Cohaesibacter gelatinilyticus]|uniref:Sulfite reductase (NADPH) hemoprotein beta-component n=1 Tax=Cohaesibacter gelatinilyticus TaxID=372072 RepID=A0A285NEX7_9HYPH|nr:nitrite/sulfite reductase [Cohaesibacter gelatinilyticus]SNZ07828.1 sulfite reductase (NADPH) hemoprotein beta-component [Cohaesibacter gelatinilyticus]
MYRYDEFDADFVRQRVAQFRNQVERRLSGELTEDQFKPLRLMNGLYLQLHAYMLRVAIPYGTLNSKQMHKLADIATKYDRGYGHFTTRQNLQYNWPSLKDTPDILEELAEVEMHAIQTSGNCIRNVTTDHFAGAAHDEIADPRVYAEIIRQWSSLHPEFTFLPRKFKIAINGAKADRAAIQVHDIGLQLVERADGGIGFTVYVGGGQGRTPMIAKKVADNIAEEDILSYLEAILRVYNRYGRRDNKYKARIKILVHETGLEELKTAIDAEWAEIKDSVLKVPQSEIDRINAYFAIPSLKDDNEGAAKLTHARARDAGFSQWVSQNSFGHKIKDHSCVTISLKPVGGVPGDATDKQMHVVADLAAQYGYDELRISHEQNIILPHVAKSDLYPLYLALVEAELAEANAGLVTDIIACPGLDYCALANARSIPISQDISNRLGSAERQKEIGELKIKISGCINACGHHHVGHIGILGVDRKGEELYQITLGGSADENTSIGAILGRGFLAEEVTDAIEKVIDTYLALRLSDDEIFIDAYRRLGPVPFKEALYPAKAA